MLRTAVVGKIICENFKNVEIDKDLVINTLLLHDMGNIIKFDLTQKGILKGNDNNRIKELIEVQIMFMKKYGNKTDKATLQIIKEVVNDIRIVDLCENSH